MRGAPAAIAKAALLRAIGIAVAAAAVTAETAAITTTAAAITAAATVTPVTAPAGVFAAVLFKAALGLGIRLLLRGDGLAEVGQLANDWDLLARELLDGTQQAALLGAAHGNGDAGHARTAGAADAVYVCLGVQRQFVVNHVADGINIKPAGGDVGGHKHLDLAAFEFVESADALVLVAVTVDGLDRDAGTLKAFGNTVGGVLGFGKYHSAGHGVGLTQVPQQGLLGVLVNVVQPLLDRGRGG